MDGVVGRGPIEITFASFDPDGDPLTFSAAGLRAGMSVNPANGTVFGTPTAPCACRVTVTAADGRGGTGSVGFELNVIAA